jgi:hypothetical protein
MDWQEEGSKEEKKIRRQGWGILHTLAPSLTFYPSISPSLFFVLLGPLIHEQQQPHFN